MVSPQTEIELMKIKLWICWIWWLSYARAIQLLAARWPNLALKGVTVSLRSSVKMLLKVVRNLTKYNVSKQI